MACEVTEKDVLKDITNKLVDKLETARPIDGGSAVFAAYNISNRSKLANQVKLAIEDIDNQFDADNYGTNFGKPTTSDFGITIPLKENPHLADALYIQNIKDEMGPDYYMGDEALRDQEEQYSFSPRLQQNAKRPLTDNFTEYRNYKLANLNRVEGLLKSYKIDKKNPKKDLSKTIEAINKLTVMKSGLQNDIEALDMKDVALMFHSISKEIDDLSKSLDESHNNNITDFKERLGFLFKFVKGTAIDDRRDLGVEHLKGFDHPDFNKISLALDDLNLKYRANVKDRVREIVNSDIQFINNTSELSEAQTEALFESKEDINALESLFLGITESSTNDTILPSIVKSTIETKATIREAEAKSYQDRLNTLVKKIGTNFDFAFERDAQGNKTGNLTSIFSPLYRNKLYAYSRIHYNETLDAGQKYLQKVNWLSENAEVIDHTKLRVIKDLFGDSYEAYFTATDAEMDAYEKDLREKLGTSYDSEIDKVINALENYQESKEALMASDDPHKYKNIARIDPWNFIKHFNSEDKSKVMPYSAPSGNTDFVYPDIANTRFIPKKEIITDWVEDPNDPYEVIPLKKKSGYYNETFEEIQKDTDKAAYLALLTEIYGDYVNPTYDSKSGMKNLSYAKFEESYFEAIENAKGATKLGKALSGAARGFKEYFYEAGSQKEGDNKVKKNYRDTSKGERSRLANVLNFKTKEELENIAVKEGLNPGDYKDSISLAKAIANSKVLGNYSNDINKVTAAILSMTALQKAKEDTLPIANLLLDAHIIASDGKRKRSIARLENYINRVIKNQNEKSKGTESVIGKPISKEGFLDMILDKTGKIPWIKDYLNEKSTMLLTPVEKEIYKHLKDIQATELDDSTRKAVEENLQSLGISANAAGIVQGIMKIVILKALALNPVSGIFNRIEGMNSGLIMDATGKYWTKGNLQKANQFMVGSNFIKFIGRLNPVQTKHVKELQKFQMLINGMGLIQDRKSDLEKSTGSGIAGFIEEKLNPYQFAVDNPEMKNQGAILLSVLMDTKIKDKDGNETSIFNGSEFPAHEVKGGNLILKEEFKTPENLSNWEHFNVDEQDPSNNDYFLTRMKIKNAISRSQGNYDNLDVIGATNTLMGRMMTMFMKWVPEHFMQRYASGEGFDLTTGKSKLRGRYRSLWVNKHLLAPVLGLSTIASFGIGAIPISVAAGSIALGLGYEQARKYFNRQNINNEAKDILSLAQFTKSTLINTLNYPLEFIGANPFLKYDTPQLPLDKRTNLSQEDINNLQAISKELAMKCTYVAMLWLGKQLLTGPDDDEDDKKLANFFDNQMSRMINSFNMWADPSALYTTAQRNAFLEYVIKLIKVMKDVLSSDEKGHLKKDVMKVLPLPLPDLVTKGEMPWQDEYEFDKEQWTDTYAKTHGAGGDEYIATKQYEALRKEARDKFTEEYEDEGLKGDALDKAVNKAMRKEFPRKKDKETNISIMNRINAGEKGSLRKRKSN